VKVPYRITGRYIETVGKVIIQHLGICSPVSRLFTMGRISNIYTNHNLHVYVTYVYT